MARADKVGEGFGGGGRGWSFAKTAKRLNVRTIKETKVVKGKIVKGSDVAKAVKKVNAKTAKAEAKANARGLKAANKPVKNKDASVMNRNNQYARQAILNEKPARPNRVRGGSMKSKQNWPEGMKKPKPSLADPKVAEAKRKADAAARLKRLDYNSRNGIF